MSPKKFSISAIILIILLAIRAVSQFLIFILPETFFDIAIILVVLIFSLVYLMALLGVILKTKWGLIITIIIAIIDILITPFSEFNTWSILGTLIFDVVLLVLSGKILTRTKG